MLGFLESLACILPPELPGKSRGACTKGDSLVMQANRLRHPAVTQISSSYLCTSNDADQEGVPGMATRSKSESL